MRIAVLAFDDPWHGSHGGTLRTRAFVDGFAGLGHQVVCIYAGAETGGVEIEGAVTRVGVAGRPAGEQGAGVGRLGELKRRYLPLPTVRGGRIPSLMQAVADHGPYDLLVVQQLRGVPYGEAAGAPLWLDQTDLWSRFLDSEIRVRRGGAKLGAVAQRLHFARLERIHARAAAVVTAAGAGDAARLSRASRRAIPWLPTPVQSFTEPVPRASGHPPTAGLLGNFGYWPNRDAYDLLVDAWLEPLRSAGWDVVVAGLGSESLPPHPGITNLGRLESVVEFYERVDLCLSPIRLGGGVKVKVLEALAAGRHVLATVESCEGFPPGSVPGVIVVEQPEAPGRLPAPVELDGRAQLVSSEAGRRFTPAGFADTLASALVDAGRVATAARPASPAARS